MDLGLVALIEFDVTPISEVDDVGTVTPGAFEGCAGSQIKPPGVLRVVTVETMVREVGIKFIDDGCAPCFERGCWLVEIYTTHITYS